MTRKATATPKIVYTQCINFMDEETFRLVHKWATEEHECNVSALVRHLVKERAAKEQQANV
jgi:hypothetical protein